MNETHTDAAQTSPLRADIPSLPTRIAMGLLIAVLVGVGVAAYVGPRLIEYPFLRIPGSKAVAITDPDSAMHWRLVVRAVNGEGTRARWMDEDNAPDGRMNEWTAPMTLVGVAGVRLTQLFGQMDQTEALRMAPLWIGPAIGLATGGLLLLFGWRLAGWPVGLGAFLAYPVLQHVFISSGLGYFDHHSLNVLIAVGIVGGSMLGRRGWRLPWAVAIGALSAVGLWSSSTEYLFILIPICVLAVADVLRAGGDAGPLRFWRVWWITGLAATFLALIWEFWPAPFHTHMEFLNIWHVALWAVGGGALEALGRFRPRWYSAVGVGIVAVAALILLAGAMKGFDYRHLHALQDEPVRRCIANTSEFISVANPGEAVGFLWENFGFLALGLVAAVAAFKDLSGGERFLLFSTLYTLVLSFWQPRWAAFLTPMLLLITALALRHLVSRRWVWLVPLAMVLASIGPWLKIHGLYEQAQAMEFNGNHPEAPYRLYVTTAVAGEQFADRGRPVVLAPLRMSSILAGSGNMRVVGSPYWSNTAGMFKHFELYSTTDFDRFEELLEAHQIEYILDHPELNANTIWLSHALLNGSLPEGRARDELVRQAAVTRYLRAARNQPGVIETDGVGMAPLRWVPTGLGPTD